MKKIVSFLLGGMLLLSLSACGSNSEHVSDNTDSAQTEPTIESISETQTPESEEINSEPKENHADERQIRVNGKDGQNIVFRLNDSTAANTLYEQLPLSIQIEDYSDNEKYFILRMNWIPAVLRWPKVRPERLHTMRPGAMSFFSMVSVEAPAVCMNLEKQCQVQTGLKSCPERSG